MKESELPALLQRAMHEEMESSYCKMFGELSKATSALFKECGDIREMCDKHLTSVENARDKLQEALTLYIKHMEGLREDYRATIQGYRDELHSAKDTINKLVAENAELAKQLATATSGTHVNVSTK